MHWFCGLVDFRPVPFMENIVAIYKSLDASFCANLFQPVSSGTSLMCKYTYLEVNMVSKLYADNNVLALCVGFDQCRC